jgi:polyhydroxyalkanoate synthesis regulator phasin
MARPHQHPPMLKDNPVVRKLVETGEERLGKLTQQLLSNEKFVAAIQGVVSRTLVAKGTLDKSLKAALSAMHLPSTLDMDKLREKVDELERLLTAVEEKLDRLGGKKP